MTDFHTLKKYLLGELADTSRIESIEMNMLSDEDFLAEIERVEAELIEDYVHQTLTAKERENFERFFLTVPRRKEKLSFMVALNTHATEHTAVTPRPAERRAVFLNDMFSVRAWRSAFAFGAVLLAVIGASWFLLRGGMPNTVNEGLLALNTAYASERPAEARFSSFDYAPWPITRGSEAPQVNSLARDKAGLLLIDAVEKTPGEDSYRALGLYYASRSEIGPAIEYFEKGLAYGPKNKQFFADYGAVLLEAAKRTPGQTPEKRLRHLENALSHIDKALSLDSDYLPALFNKALCLQEMNSPSAAREAWQNYITKDANSRWTKEAQEYIRNLDEKKTGAKSPPQVLNDFIQAFEQGNKDLAWKIAGESKEMITGTMLSEQLARGLLSADAHGAPKDTNRMLSALSYLGQLEKENSGDIFFSDLADYYRGTSDLQRAKLAEAQALTLAGYELCQNGKYIGAMEKFRQARVLFAAAGNNFEAAKTDYWIAYCVVEKDMAESLRLTASIADYSRSRSYKWLLGQALTLTGSDHIRQSQFSAGLRSTKEALKIARETGDAYNLQKASVQLADLYTQLNEPAGSLENSQNSLSESGSYFNSPRQTWRNYMFAARVSYRFGMGETAIAYAREGLRLNEEIIRDPGMSQNSFFLLSAAYKATLNYDDALKAADESVRLAGAFDAGPTQQRFLMEALLQKAEVERALSNCPAAIVDYDKALTIIREQGKEKTVKNYYALKGKLLCYETLGQSAKMTEELPLVLDLAESLRGEIEEEDAKTAFFAGEQSIYEFAAEQSLKKKDIESAFNFVEREKARSLLDGLKPRGPDAVSGPANVLSLAEIQERMPAGAQMVQYAVLPDKVLIWTVSGSGIHFAEKPVTEAKLNSLVRELAENVSHPASTDRERVNKLSTELYDLLIAPAADKLEPGKEVVIVPDKILCYLQFQMLRSPAGRYALEDNQFSYSPSGTLFLLLSQRSAQLAANRPRQKESFLGVGNPAFDREINPSLSPLTAAESEIRNSAGFYPVSNQMIGKGAVKEKILKAISEAEIFHFAGHYRANDLSPRFSKLLIASGTAGSENDLTAAEIGRLKLARTRLVILSACNTAVEGYYHGEGAIGIARTFFAAGAPAVIASRWEVDSAATAKLMTAFHRYRREQNFSASAALRAAQLDMLKDKVQGFDSPYFWAAFAVIGGIEEV